MDRIQEALSDIPRADKQRGQGMVEYIIIVALIALAAAVDPIALASRR